MYKKYDNINKSTQFKIHFYSYSSSKITVLYGLQTPNSKRSKQHSLPMQTSTDIRIHQLVSRIFSSSYQLLSSSHHTSASGEDERSKRVAFPSFTFKKALYFFLQVFIILLSIYDSRFLRLKRQCLLDYIFLLLIFLCYHAHIYT